jgi:ribosomal-protein-alanine N-acetyltransferase
MTAYDAAIDAPAGYGIRPLGDRDLGAVAAIEAVVNPHPWTRDLFATELDLPPANRHWLVAQVAAGPDDDTGGEVVGYGGIMLAVDTAHILNLGVAPAHTRRGLGERLCLELVAEAARRGAAELTLEVRVSNGPAIALYQKLGMTLAGNRPGYYSDGEDALIYWFHDLAERPRP